MRISRNVLGWCVPLVIAALVAVAWLVRTPRINASLYDLIGEEASRIPAFLRNASATEIAMVVSSDDAENAMEVAKELAEEFSVSTDMMPGAMEFIRDNRGGLVTAEIAELLRTREGRAKIAKRAVRRVYSSPMPPVLGYADDPFWLTDSWLLSLASARAEKTHEGWPRIETNGVTRILLRHTIDGETAADIDKTIAAIGKIERLACDVSSRHQASVRLAGAPVHAASSARRCKAEIGWLTWLSLSVIAVLAIFVFRSLGWLPLFTGALLVAALAGAFALVSCFREIHVMTLVMGTTVLGLVIDYSFHWLLSTENARPTVRKNLLVSFLTTEISLVPLMLASIVVLRQSAVFLGAGLAAALAYVLACYPRNYCQIASSLASDDCRASLRVSWRWPRVVAGAIACIVIAGIFHVSVKTDVRALYRPSADLLEAECQRAQFGGFDFAALPTLQERQTNATFVRMLHDEHAAKLANTLGMPSLTAPPVPTDGLMRPQELMNEIFSAWTEESLRRLALSIVVLVAVVACFFRKRSLRVLAPPFLSILFVVGMLGWTGAPVNLFHLFAVFLLLGMGIDYAVFLQSGDRASLRPALCSLLTSVVGFGSLSFVSFPVVRSFGFVLGMGLPVAFVSALAIRESDVQVSSLPTGDGDVRTEHGASLVGMETLFFIYRAFGLRVLHSLAAAVGICVWLFSPAVRRASPSVGKIMMFTRSLADKLVILAEGSDLPQVHTDNSSDAVSFVEDVRSGKGVFVLSSHVGTIEALMTLGECDCTFHAWMDFNRTGVFNRFYLRHAKRPRVKIHPISEFGMGTVFEAGDWIDGGDCLMMAGDRGKGAFSFAAAFDHPVYFVACISERGCRYRAVIRRLPERRTEMETAYDEIRERLESEFKSQCFTWRMV